MHPIRLSLAATLAALLFVPVARCVELRNFGDAALRAVQFVDAKEGWVAGDDGVVWHTIDGGKDWERQKTGVRASLRSIHFVNPYIGWVAGREELPGGLSAGVLLYTEDAGVKWQRILTGSVPGLNFVRFVDEKTGYLAGDGSDQYPSGVFVTRDGGVTWLPVPGPRFASWLGGAVAERGAALVGAWGQVGVLQPDRVGRDDSVEGLGARAMRGVCFQGKRGVAVGQGGLILTNDGAGWGASENTGLPIAVRQSWDFHCVHGTNGQFWAAGRPGSALLHSRDNGEHWEVQYTRQNLPLNGVFFLDERTGWAVGELGVILTTADGGKTWRVQRRGGERAAVLFVHSRAAGMPLDTVALLGGQDGYLTAGVRVVTADPDTANPSRCADGDRLAAAWRLAGGASSEMLWQFPLSAHAVRSDRESLIKSWDQLHGGTAADNLLRQMVLAMRTWRPAVVVTDCPHVAADGFGTDGAVSEAVREAFRLAADPKAFPEHANFLGLEPWQPRKVYARWEGRTDAEVKIDLTAVSPPLRATLQEFATPPMSLLVDGAPPIPATRLFRFLAGVEGTQTETELMQGVNLMPDGVARRPLTDLGEPSGEETRTINQRKILRALGETPPTALNTPERLVGQMGGLLADLPDDMAGRAAFAIGSQFARNGQWSLASEAFLLMADRYPTHPLTVEAYRWLIRHSSSSEVRRRYELRQFVAIAEHEEGVKGERNQSVVNPDGRSNAVVDKLKVPEIEQKRDSGSFFNHLQARQWYLGPLELEKRLGTFGPLFANDPATQFCLQSARRQLGDVKNIEEARKWYGRFAAKQPEGPWRDAALAELWLLNRTGPSPKPVAVCRYTDTKPFLDGKLDDACWLDAAVLRLGTAGETRKDLAPEARLAREKFVKDYPTEVRMAHDEEYLYIAVRCFHPPEKQVAPVKGRTRDADLRAFDRVSIMLDLDRDYSTYFHLQIDQRGCVAEDCWGDKTWDPRWFVAMQSGPTVWVAEAAIPLAALSGDPVLPGRAWAFNAVRVLPGRGVQAWSLPADVPEESPRPEGMGLLIFAKDQVPMPAAQ